MVSNKEFKQKAPPALKVVVMLALAALACAITASGLSANSTSRQTADLVASANKVLAMGEKGVLYCPGTELGCNLDNIFSDTKWHGPTTAPSPPTGKKLVIIPVVNGGEPLLAAQGVEDAAKALGWTTTVIAGQGTPSSYQTAFQSALADKPDAIVLVSIPESQVGNYIPQARKAGIKMVEADGYPPSSGEKYDAYVTDMSGITGKVEAWYAIAKSNGTAQAVMFWDPSALSLAAGLAGAKAEFAKCSGCKVLQSFLVDSSEGANPTKESADVSSLLQKYGDKLQYLLTAYGFGLQSVATTVGSCNCSTQVLTKNGEQASLQLVKQGLVQVDSGTNSTWIGWAAVDQLIRVFAGQKPLGPFSEGLPLHIFTKSNLPPNNLWVPAIDFKAKYKKIWGLH
jgi:ribose transport system substrate-binding protein